MLQGTFLPSILKSFAFRSEIHRVRNPALKRYPGTFFGNETSGRRAQGKDPMQALRD